MTFASWFQGPPGPNSKDKSKDNSKDNSKDDKDKPTKDTGDKGTEITRQLPLVIRATRKACGLIPKILNPQTRDQEAAEATMLIIKIPETMTRSAKTIEPLRNPIPPGKNPRTNLLKCSSSIVEFGQNRQLIDLA